MNYYEILNIDKDASDKEIRDSYKKLMKQYHPDIYKGNKNFAEKISMEINNAYSVLSDRTKREEYNNLLLEEALRQDTEYNYTSPDLDFETLQKSAPKTPPKPSWEEKLKKKIYEFVDKQTNGLSKELKILIVIFILAVALLFTLITFNDYVNFLYAPSEDEFENISYYNPNYYRIEEY